VLVLQRKQAKKNGGEEQKACRRDVQQDAQPHHHCAQIVECLQTIAAIV